MNSPGIKKRGRRCSDMKDSILKEIYYGDFEPIEQFAYSLDEYKKMYYEVCEKENDIRYRLPKELEKDYVNLMNKIFLLEPLAVKDAFIMGFKAGARIMVEVFEE